LSCKIFLFLCVLTATKNFVRKKYLSVKYWRLSILCLAEEKKTFKCLSSKT
jgi:hypothetical protein